MAEIERHCTERIQHIRERLISEFGKPEWRSNRPPVDELVLTILSQNTNDVNRDAAFKQLKKTFSDWESVKDANPEELIAAIRTAGLANQKGPRIQQALQDIADHTGGDLRLDFLKEMPLEDARGWLMNIKGVGPKTAAIVLLFSLGIPAFPVDTHVYRVTGRLGLRPESYSVEKTHKFLEENIPEDAYYDLHLNLIRLGREICGARKWYCYRCPIVEYCDFEEKNLDPSEM